MFITIHIHSHPISSASDLSEQIIFDSWSMLQSSPDVCGSLIQQYVVKALDWLQKKSIEISRIGSICNVLHYTNDVRLKEDFCVRVIYSLGYALGPTHQNEFATKVVQSALQIIPIFPKLHVIINLKSTFKIFEWADIYIPSGKEPKYCFFNKYREAVELYESDDMVEIDSIDNIVNYLIKTTKIKTYLNILKLYLEQCIPFNIIGPSGSGTR